MDNLKLGLTVSINNKLRAMIYKGCIMIKKLFGEVRMTWKLVISFALIAGIFTALMAMFVPDGNSFHEIAVSFEAWILFAIIIIVNCETPKEAALKTFMFFLISQPLIYLIQVPFSSMGFSLFIYYKYWFIWTLLTIPGAYIGWFIKKDNIFSAIILSVMLVFLILLGMVFAKDMILHFPDHLISTIFCFAQVPLLIFGVFDNKKTRFMASAISALAVASLAFFIFSKPLLDFTSNVSLDKEKYPLDSYWTVTVSDEKISTAYLKDDTYGRTTLIMHYFYPGSNTVILKDGAGNEHSLIISCDKDLKVTVQG